RIHVPMHFVTFLIYLHHLTLHSFPTRRSSDLSDLPEIFPNKWMEGNVANYQAMLRAMEEVGNNLDVTIGEPMEELGSAKGAFYRSEEHTSELQSRFDIVCRLLLEKKNIIETYS